MKILISYYSEFNTCLLANKVWHNNMQSRVFSKFNKRQERVNEQKNGVRFENYTEDNSVVF